MVSLLIYNLRCIWKRNTSQRGNYTRDELPDPEGATRIRKRHLLLIIKIMKIIRRRIIIVIVIIIAIIVMIMITIVIVIVIVIVITERSKPVNATLVFPWSRRQHARGFADFATPSV